MRADLLVMGTGPAGLAVARSAAARGMRVACVDPAPHAPWQRSFGVWECEAAELGELAPREASFARPLVDLGGEGRIVLDAAYCRLDVAELQRRLQEALRAAGSEMITGRVAAVQHGTASSRVRLDGGVEIDADVVVDATGAQSPCCLLYTSRCV